MERTKILLISKEKNMKARINKEENKIHELLSNSFDTKRYLLIKQLEN